MDVGAWRARLRAAVSGLGCSPVEAVALAVLVAGALAVLGVLWAVTPGDERPGAPGRAGAHPDVSSGADADGSAGAGADASSAASADAPTEGEDGLPVTAEEVVVHVTGAVDSPGLYHLPGGARVADALEAAGGPAAEAVLDTVNLARAVTDGEQVAVPDRAAVERAEEGEAGQRPDGKTDLNRASASDLENLPGVGPVLAARIVGHRERHGPFARVADLLEVAGIGERTLEAVEELVTT